MERARTSSLSERHSVGVIAGLISARLCVCRGFTATLVSQMFAGRTVESSWCGHVLYLLELCASSPRISDELSGEREYTISPLRKFVCVGS